MIRPLRVPVGGWEHGTDPTYLCDLVHHWRHGVDRAARAAELDAVLPSFIADVDGLDVHLAVVEGLGVGCRSRAATAVAC